MRHIGTSKISSNWDFSVRKNLIFIIVTLKNFTNMASKKWNLNLDIIFMEDVETNSDDVDEEYFRRIRRMSNKLQIGQIWRKRKKWLLDTN